MSDSGLPQSIEEAANLILLAALIISVLLIWKDW